MNWKVLESKTDQKKEQKKTNEYKRQQKENFEMNE